MKLKRVVLYILVVIVIFSVVGCKAKDEDNNKLRVGMELQFPPFETADETGKPVGISIDIAEGLAKHLGKELEIVNTSWVGLIPSLQTGKIDLVLSSMSITEERSRVVDFSLPYANSGLSLLLNSNSPVTSFEDMNSSDVVVAVKSGTVGAILAQKKLPDATIRVFDDVANCVLEVSQGKANAFIYDALTVYENHKKHSETTKMNLKSIESSEQAWAIAVKKGNTELLESINVYIKQSQEERTFEKIGDKYLGDLMKIFKENGVKSFFEVK